MSIHSILIRIGLVYIVSIYICFVQPSYADIIFGAEANTNRLYEINTETLETKLATTMLVSEANGLAWDSSAQRLYYVNNGGGHLYCWERLTDTHYSLGHITDYGGPNDLDIRSASFYNNAYHFIHSNTADSWRVTFDYTNNLLIKAVEWSNDMIPHSYNLTGGDIVVDKNGLVYGSALVVDDGIVEFFSYDIAIRNYKKIKEEEPSSTFPLSQLVFDTKGNLFAGNIDDGNVFVINVSNGEYTLKGTTSIAVTDLAGAIGLPTTVEVMVHLQGYWDGSVHVSAPVAIELRSGNSLPNSTFVDIKTGMLNSTGNVELTLDNLESGFYWIVVRASGYIPIGSAQSIQIQPGVTTHYNFTDSNGKAYGIDAQLLIDGSYVMRAGDLNGDQNVLLNDFLHHIHNYGQFNPGDVPQQ